MPTTRPTAICLRDAERAVARAERAKKEGVTPFIQYMLNRDAQLALAQYREALDRKDPS